MRKLILAAAVAAFIPTVASAQDVTPAKIEPYFGVLAGGDAYKTRSDFGTVGDHGAMHGSLLEGVGGVNIPIGDAFFVGGEGNVAKGIKDIDWEYGARGRAGLRTGSTGLIYLSAGHEWVDGRRGFAHLDNWVYGFGLEVSAAGLSSAGSGPKSPRIRFQVETYDFQSIRPMAGIVFGF